MTNPLDRLTGAIHVYGGDFFGGGRSEWDPENLLERDYDYALHRGCSRRRDTACCGRRRRRLSRSAVGWDDGLARCPRAVCLEPGQQRGRLHPEPESDMRSPFQRDRDRIIHSTAFRRLKHKTQVFVYHEGDHYRTRLTHTLEVAQIARTVARALGLDEDLAEAVALAHDLGHTPFGHAGEEALRRDAALRRLRTTPRPCAS